MCVERGLLSCMCTVPAAGPAAWAHTYSTAAPCCLQLYFWQSIHAPLLPTCHPWLLTACSYRWATGRWVTCSTDRHAACPLHCPPCRYAPAQNCSAAERYPGMWEVPLWVLAAKGMYSMDYGDTTNSVYDVLKVSGWIWAWLGLYDVLQGGGKRLVLGLCRVLRNGGVTGCERAACCCNQSCSGVLCFTHPSLFAHPALPLPRPSRQANFDAAYGGNRAPLPCLSTRLG